MFRIVYTHLFSFISQKRGTQRDCWENIRLSFQRIILFSICFIDAVLDNFEYLCWQSRSRCWYNCCVRQSMKIFHCNSSVKYFITAVPEIRLEKITSSNKLKLMRITQTLTDWLVFAEIGNFANGLDCSDAISFSLCWWKQLFYLEIF